MFESVTSVKRGNPHLLPTDTDKDSFADVDGVLVSIEHIYLTSGMAQKIDYFKTWQGDLFGTRQ